MILRTLKLVESGGTLEIPKKKNTFARDSSVLTVAALQNSVKNCINK